MKFLFNLFLLYPFLVFTQNEVKIEYWDNGKVLSQVHYNDGERDGSCRYYFNNGIMMVEGFYVKGKMSGYWHTFYENGQLHQKGKNDHRNKGMYSQKTGKWLEYTPDGKLFSESSIILGIENRNFFNNDGTVQSKLLNGC